ncbi:MAG TPA: GIY-YIG nuclease family protein, partial [Xanthobacteraceae bacterium]
PKPSNAVDWRVAKAVDTSNIRSFGKGEQNVYVYVYGYDFAPDRLKIGKAEGDVVRRIASQINTGTPGRPILYLIFQTDDCHNLEKALHQC